ncbi:MAG: NAD-dependent deacylase [Desulfobacterales bacterium]|jgi:NAD-dependent deacetylase
MTSPYLDVAELLLRLKNCVVLTGAGISAESGIPTFRSKDGLWEKYDPMVYASIEVFRKDPSKYWQIRGDFIRDYDSYEPNTAHRALVELENLGIVRQVITQNIDGLHRKAGSRRVVEIHGSLREIICQQCDRTYLAPNIPGGNPPHCECGGVLKPNTVLFGEQLPTEALEVAIRESSACRIMLVIGTSAVVYPAAHLPVVAKQHGAKIVEINIERAFPDADVVILDKAASAMTRLLEAIKTLQHTSTE